MRPPTKINAAERGRYPWRTSRGILRRAYEDSAQGRRRRRRGGEGLRSGRLLRSQRWVEIRQASPEAAPPFRAGPRLAPVRRPVVRPRPRPPATAARLTSAPAFRQRAHPSPVAIPAPKPRSLRLEGAASALPGPTSPPPAPQNSPRVTSYHDLRRRRHHRRRSNRRRPHPRRRRRRRGRPPYFTA